MRKTKSDTMAFKKQNNLTFQQKLDGCMLNSWQDFIIDNRRRNTHPEKVFEGLHKTALIGQRITGN